MGKAPDIEWKIPTNSHLIVLFLLSMFHLAQQQARQAPFCVDDTNQVPYEEGLHYFQEIFEYHFDDPFVPVSDGTTSPSGLITKFELKGIQIDDTDSGYKADFHNWVHITIESAIPIEGLYVQANSAPWGTPFGEFLADFDCGDCSVPTSQFKKDIAIIPCIHRPAFEYTHPNVFTVGGTHYYYRRPRTKFKEIHFNFRYTQYPGVDYTFAQFLIIAVRDFYEGANRFETFYSQIYQMKIDKNPIGAFTPFYYGWPPKFIKCHQLSLKGEMEPLKVNNKYKLRYSQEFDNCVLQKEGQDWYTCPPGPTKLEPSEVPHNLNEWKAMRKKYIMEADSGLSTTTPGSAGSLGGVQFCADAGDWGWNLGQLNWSLPRVINYHNETIDLSDNIDGEDNVNRDAFETVDCDEFDKHPSLYRNDPEIAEICASNAACINVHVTDCETLTDIPLPKYGKKFDGSRPVVKDWKLLSFSDQVDEIGWRWGDQNVLDLHGKLLLFSVTAGFNIMAFVARYMKEEKSIQPRSGCFGIGKWLWIHIGITYVIIGFSAAGFFMVAFQNYQSSQHDDDLLNGPRDLCNVRPTKHQTELCLKTRIHRYMGVACVMFFVMSYATAWKRPAIGFRNVAVIYHVICGYVSKITGIASIAYSGYSLSKTTIAYLCLIEVTALIGFVLAELLLCIIDKKLKITNRKRCPVIEGMIIDELPKSHERTKRSLLLLFVAVQITLYIMAMLQSYFTLHSEFSYHSLIS